MNSSRPVLVDGLALGLALWGSVALSQVGTGSLSSTRGVYTNATLGFRYTSPDGMRDKTARFQLQIQDPSLASGIPQTLGMLLAMSSGPDSDVSTWRSLTIVTYPRSAVSEPDNAKAEAQMSAWVAHSEDASALPKSVVISAQSFTVSLFGLQEGSVKKGAAVWTTVREGKLLSFAFVANSPDQLDRLTESMKSLQFF
jgi:hypothetical protein